MGKRKSAFLKALSSWGTRLLHLPFMLRTTTAGSLSQLHTSRDDNKNRPDNIDESPRNDAERPEQEIKPEQDNESRYGLVTSAPTGLSAHFYTIIFHGT